MIYFERTSQGEIAATVFVNDATGEAFRHTSGARGFQRVAQSSNLAGFDFSSLIPLITQGVQIGANFHAQNRQMSEAERAAVAQNEARFLAEVYTPVFTQLDSLIATPRADGAQVAAQLESMWSAGVQQFSGMALSDYGRSWISEATAAVRGKVEKIRQASATAPQSASTSASAGGAVVAQSSGFPLWVVAVAALAFVIFKGRQ